MVAPLIYIDPESKLSLQRQLRQKLVEAVLMGTFPLGKRLPSSRKLSEQLCISRNTVVLAYQQLIDESYLVTRERSGIFVNEKIFEGRILASNQTHSAEDSARWKPLFKHRTPKRGDYQVPPDWHRYPYPFLENQFDTSLFPVNEWREASKLALGVKEVNEWASFATDADDPQLLEEIRTKLLPSRGINAAANEILITSGEQQALYLLLHMFVDSHTKVATEEPGNPLVAQLLDSAGAPRIHQPVDNEGMLVTDALDAANLVYVTPSHQLPTTATMSMERRGELLQKAEQQDFLIIEDDASLEHNFLGSPHPALRSMDKNNRVIYLSSLSKILSPGLRLSFIVGPAEVIGEARRLRRVLSGYPARNNQRAMSFFLSLGHYDAFIRNLDKELKERWMELRDGLNYKLHSLAETTPTDGGTAYWVKLHNDIDVRFLAQQAAREGILIEPIDHYYSNKKTPSNIFRLGITSIPKERIREGVERLAELIVSIGDPAPNPLARRGGKYIGGDRIRDLIVGSSIISSTVYGDPYTIDVFADGSLVGRCGYENEDCDVGKWWIEGDLLYRQWNVWVYGEQQAFHIACKGEQIRWYNLDDQLIVSGVLKKGPTEPED